MAGTRPESWRIVLMTDAGGQIAGAVQRILAGMGHRVVGIVTSPGPRGRGLGRHLEVVATAPRSVDVIVSNHPKRWAAMLAPLQPDLIFSAVFPWIIPDDVIALPRVAAVNLHGGLLPRGRGPNAFGWAFRNGDPEVGLTMHYLDSGLDTGPVLAQVSVPVGDEDDMETLFPRLVPLAPGLLARAIQRIAAGDPGDIQDESLATYDGIFEEAYRAIDWSRPAREVHNQARAWMAGLRGSIPGAIGTLDGTPLRILRTGLVTEEGTGAAPGSVVARDDEGMTVQCGTGRVKVLRSEPVAP
ncbi:MAG TPA: methionyl-tRNA formyltransferase [Thermomicrobiaceae bacterium]|nr:methionyl-tRNA formyltransferase [Thermomicrobiaceae bacterium]